MGAHRTGMGTKRQRDAVYVYSNEKVLKACKRKKSATIVESDSDSDSMVLVCMSDNEQLKMNEIMNFLVDI